jgi:hypothetical protein
MAELAGKEVVIKISGSALSFVGEATSSTDNKNYQITAAAKQVLDKDATISVHKFDSDDEAEAGTTTTNITMTAHGLVTGDLIVNETRSNAARIVTYVNADNVTVTAVTSQTSTDVIAKYPTELSTAYTLDRLNGKATYSSALARTILISGEYLPMATAAYANSMSRTQDCELHETPRFGQTHMNRVAGLKSAAGTLTQIDVTDTTYIDALIAGEPVVIENAPSSSTTPERYWAIIEASELSAAINGVQEEVVTWTSTDEWS